MVVQNQDSIADWFEEAKAAGKLGQKIIRQKASTHTAEEKQAEHD